MLTKEILQHLLQGPPKSEVPSCWVVCEYGQPENTVLEFKSTIREYYPGPEYPTHIIFWSKGSIHISNYRSIEYCREVKEDYYDY